MVNTKFGCLAHSSISFRKCKCGLISHSYLERESDSPSFQRLYQACHSRICSLCPTNASLLQFSSLHFSPVVFLSFVLSIIIVSGLLSKAVIRSYHLEYYYKSVHIPQALINLTENDLFAVCRMIDHLGKSYEHHEL